MQAIRVIGLDADDTLWHNESVFERVHQRYRALLSQYHDAPTVDQALIETERRNLSLYGYGVKGFTLSAIETAIELTAGKIGTDEIRSILASGREMLAHPVELFEGVRETMAALAGNYRLILITKGDLLHQQSKLEKSGLAAHFQHIEIVSEKNPETYACILKRLAIAPSTFLMVGDSLKSDILPVLQIGGSAVHIPHCLQWELDQTDQKPSAPGRFFELQSITALPPLLSAPTLQI